MTATITIPKIVRQMPRFSRTWVNHWMMHFTTVSLDLVLVLPEAHSVLLLGARGSRWRPRDKARSPGSRYQKSGKVSRLGFEFPKFAYTFTLFDFPFIKFWQNIEMWMLVVNVRSKVFSHFDEQVSVLACLKSVMLVSVPAPVSPAALITMHRIQPLSRLSRRRDSPGSDSGKSY